MGAMLGAGALMIAYSPIACVILGYTARRSALLVLTIARCVPPERARAAAAAAAFHKRPTGHRTVLSAPAPVSATCSAFAWLMAILLASLIWLAIPPLKVRARVERGGGMEWSECVLAAQI
jgi:hypothetical protein